MLLLWTLNGPAFLDIRLLIICRSRDAEGSSHGGWRGLTFDQPLVVVAVFESQERTAQGLDGAKVLDQQQLRFQGSVQPFTFRLRARTPGST